MGKDLPGPDTPEMHALIKAVAEGPRRDNSAYHRAIAEARRAFEAAEEALGGPVRFKTKTKIKSGGEFAVKWTFRRAK